MPVTDADLEDLVARRDIYAVLTRYCRALDRCDVALMQSVYWPDGIDNHGVFNGNAAEFAAFIIREIQRWFDVTMHAIMNIHIDVDGDRAASEAYLFAYHKVRADMAPEIFGSRYMAMFELGGLDPSRLDRGNHHFYYGGRYLDRLERRNGEWRISKRQVIMDWNDNKPSGEILDQGMFATLTPRGERGASDLVFGNRP
jgi:hypothetical protein